MSEYATIRRDMEEELHKLRNLRDSQTEGSEQYEHFQQKAVGQADTLILLEQNEAALVELDNAVRQRESTANRAQNVRRREVRRWRRITAVPGVLGFVTVSGGVALSLPVVVVLVGVLLLVGAGLAGWRWWQVNEELQVRELQEAVELKAARDQRYQFGAQVLPVR